MTANTVPLKTVAQGVGLQVAQILQGRSREEIEAFIEEMHTVIQGGGLALVEFRGRVQ